MSKKKLNPKQQVFITNYLIYRNATKAAKIAGYSLKTARSIGARLLTNVDISEAIECGLKEQLSKADISADYIIQELRKIAFADSRNLGKLKALELFGKSLGLFQRK